MSRTLTSILAIFALAVLAGGVAAEVPKEGAVAQVEAALAPADAGKTVQPQLGPMHQEIAALNERLKVEVNELASRFAQASDPQQRLAIQRRIDEAKRSIHLGSLEIQLRYAQAEGREAAAALLTQAIEQFKNPVVANAKPVERARPSESTQH
jgi:hypothetical protein